MAFPIPEHLPRKANPQDVSSKILYKIDSATKQTLNSALATSWVAELDETIRATRERIHERIHEDLPAFNQQLQASQSVQERLSALTANVDSLTSTISNPSTGLVPVLLERLTKHATLAQDSLDASVAHNSLSHLLRCRQELETLAQLEREGKLPDAIQHASTVESLLSTCPDPLSQTTVLRDMKQHVHTTRARVDDQLNDAYLRSIVLTSAEFVVRASVQVRGTETILSTSSVLASLSPSFLSTHLTVLRRDLTTFAFEPITKQHISVSTSRKGETEERLIFDSAHGTLPSTLSTLSQTLDFLASHLFPCLPLTQRSEFALSLSAPLTTSLLNNLLIPSLPSTFADLPPFLELVRDSVTFEQRYIHGVLGHDPRHTVLKDWADEVSSHYERRRRLDILEQCRLLVTSADTSKDTFQVEVDILPPPELPEIMAEVQEEEVSPKDDAWGFEEDGTSGFAGAEADEWGFGDEDVTMQDTSNEGASITEAIEENEEPDPSDAWGWNDDAEGSTEASDVSGETAWDDPWDEPAADSPVKLKPSSVPSIASAPKNATRLEKFASKGKKPANGHSVASSPALPSTGFAQASSLPAVPTLAPAPNTLEKRPSQPRPPVKEAYAVSKRTQSIVTLVSDVLGEGQEYVGSHLFSSKGSTTTTSPGMNLFQCAPSVLDLYCALYPTKFARELKTPEGGMRFSNDCLYLEEAVESLERAASSRNVPGPVKDRLVECRHRLKVLSDSWFEEVIERGRQSVEEILNDGAQGFISSGEQDRYDECESAVMQVLQHIRRLSKTLKGILTKTRYYVAIGQIADAALKKILGDVLALPDIPEIESHRLGELCRILNALEGLFVEDPSQPSFVVAYVSSWLKYSYLSELLEAFMADISYLFEEGALVDFDVEELVRLVRALFADTMLRTDTINKILNGHPNRS